MPLGRSKVKGAHLVYSSSAQRNYSQWGSGRRPLDENSTRSRALTKRAYPGLTESSGEPLMKGLK